MDILRKMLAVVFLLVGIGAFAQKTPHEQKPPQAPSEKHAKKTTKKEAHDIEKRSGVTTKDDALKLGTAGSGKERKKTVK